MRKVEYEDWKSNVIVANKLAGTLLIILTAINRSQQPLMSLFCPTVSEKKTKQSQLNFTKKSVSAIPLKS